MPYHSEAGITGHLVVIGLGHGSLDSIGQASVIEAVFKVHGDS